MILPVILCLLAGVLFGALLRTGGLIFDTDAVTMPVLWVLVLAAGIDMGNMIRKNGWRSLLESAREAVSALLGTFTGTLLAGGLAGLLLRMTMNRALAVSGGFGWYTLSSVMLSQMDSPELGALAFLSNVFREVLAFLLIPLLAKKGWKASCISVAGATSMDTTLPVVSRCCGSETAAASFVHGLLFTFLVPVLVPVLYSLPV